MARFKQNNRKIVASYFLVYVYICAIFIYISKSFLYLPLSVLWILFLGNASRLLPCQNFAANRQTN